MALALSVQLSSWGNAWLALIPIGAVVSLVWRYTVFESFGYTRAGSSTWSCCFRALCPTCSATARSLPALDALA